MYNVIVKQLYATFTKYFKYMQIRSGKAPIVDSIQQSLKQQLTL